MTKNVILISMDDAGGYAKFRDAFGEPLQVPNLDQIEAQSTSFRAAYCQAPVCGPSRNSLMSGLSPHQTGILDNYTKLFDVLRPEQLWQFRLKQKGYYCSTAGKVHHGYKPLPEDAHNALYSHRPRPLVRGPGRLAKQQRFGGMTGGVGTTLTTNDPAYYDHQSASNAIRFLESRGTDVPFYREIGFHHPHTTWKTPIRFKELYDVTRFTPPKEWRKGFNLAAYPDQFFPGEVDMRDLDFWRKSIRNYFSAFSHVDYQIGRIWKALQASPHAKNTIVIITSDHGYHLGDKNRIRKFTLWEESCRVPLIVYDPDATPQIVEDPVALLDVGPTILDYTDSPPMKHSQGQSLKPIIHGARDEDRVVPTFVYGNVGIRKGQYRLIRYQNGETELQDVLADPWFTKDLGADHPMFASLYEDLLQTSADHGLALNDTTAGAVGFRLDNAGQARGALGAVGMLDGAMAGFEPSLQANGKHFTTLSHAGSMRLPQGCNRVHYGADNGKGIGSFACFGNASDETFYFPGSMIRFDLSVTSGPGFTTVRVGNDPLIVHQGTGAMEVTCSQRRSALVAGAGDMTVHATHAPASVQGGTGNLKVNGSIGRLDVVSGSGRNDIDASQADPASTLRLVAGENKVALGEAAINMKLNRTGLPHHIEGFRAGKIDLSDWADLGPISLVEDKGRCILRCVTETAIFHETKAEAIRRAVTGAALLPAGTSKQ